MHAEKAVVSPLNSSLSFTTVSLVSFNVDAAVARDMHKAPRCTECVSSAPAAAVVEFSRIAGAILGGSSRSDSTEIIELLGIIYDNPE